MMPLPSKFNELVQVTIRPDTISTAVYMQRLKQMILDSTIPQELRAVYSESGVAEAIGYFHTLISWTATLDFSDDLTCCTDLVMLREFWQQLQAMGADLDIVKAFACYSEKITVTARSGWIAAIIACQKLREQEQHELLAPVELQPDSELTPEQLEDPNSFSGVFQRVARYVADFRTTRSNIAVEKRGSRLSRMTGGSITPST